MIVLLNSIPFAGLPDIVQQLASRYENGDGVDIHTLASGSPVPLEDIGRLVADRKHAGKQHFVFSFNFFSPDVLKELRDFLDRYDDEIYAFRIHFRPKALELFDETLRSSYRLWNETQEKGAVRGDMGYALRFENPDRNTIVQAIWEDIHAPVELVDYNPRWPEMFAQEKTLIFREVQNLVFDIEHVGSTAIPGMPAKPILDILVVVENLEEAWKCIEPLQRLGYAFIDYPQNRTRRFYRKGKPRSHHIHLVERGSAPHRDHINFRDALLADEKLRREYLQLKRDAMGEFKHRRALYGERKGALIRRALKK